MLVIASVTYALTQISSTPSRCGMVWYSQEALPLAAILEAANVHQSVKQHFQNRALVQQVIQAALEKNHCMEMSRMAMVDTVVSLLADGQKKCEEHDVGIPLPDEHKDSFMEKWLLLCLLWGIGGSLCLKEREEFSREICKLSSISTPTGKSHTLLDYEVRIEDAEWHLWSEQVPDVEIEARQILDTDVVIATVDTVRHTHIVQAWVHDNKPIVLCGPPGSGKTMSLNNVLQALPNVEVAYLNFSSETTPELILKTIEQHCVLSTSRNGLLLSPQQPGRALVLFCDEVNIPAEDKYGTQRVISFMRQLIEQKGFWRKGNEWVTIERIYFVCACNPPTDPGRYPLSLRFLRHAAVLFVDYPGHESLTKIFSVFANAMLKLHPSLRRYGMSLTEAMVDVYNENSARFDIRQHPQYVYSPRELTRWIRAMAQAPFNSVEELARLWFHEGLRLFHDRLVTEEEREWCMETFEAIGRRRFTGADRACFMKPVYFSNWLNKDYVSVDKEQLRAHIEARLRVFYEEELNVPLVVFDDVLEHVLRIDRVLRQPFGHLLLIGESGCGKTVLSRFVAWMNGMKVFQIKASRKYSLQDFDDDLRHVMRRAGCHGEKTCFIFDESNVLQSAFLEKMNALLASGSIPGLFQGDEYNALMTSCRQAFSRLDTEEEYFSAFTRQVQLNLHVVFTMNPASSDLRNRSRTSPALFNRCCVNWVGTWSNEALLQVAREFTRNIENESLASVLVSIHTSHSNRCSPRDYLDLINHLSKVYKSKREELEEQQLSLNVGLSKLQETSREVQILSEDLDHKSKELEQKNAEAR